MSNSAQGEQSNHQECHESSDIRDKSLPTNVKSPLLDVWKNKLLALSRIRKSRSSRQQGKESIDFPPPSWNIDETHSRRVCLDVTGHDTSLGNGDEPSSRSQSDSYVISPPADALTEAEQRQIFERYDLEDPHSLERGDDLRNSEQAEPSSIARRIQALLPVLHIPLTSALRVTSSETTLTSLREVDTPLQNEEPSSGSSRSSPSTDNSLMSMLSSVSIMNGYLSNSRESVWSILDSLSPRRSSAISSQPDSGDPITNRDVGNSPEHRDLMLYSPLIPDRNSIVEFARSEIITGDGEEQDPATASVSEAPGECHKETDDGQRGTEERKPPKEKIIWVPSTTKISMQATWWGYRIYLPPPVLAVLNNKQLETAKRAALFTTSLKWLLDHIPPSILPPQFRIAVTALKTLIPYLGYIGGFVAWSWSSIKIFDKGYGVILTATWLLPVALIPGTWEASEAPWAKPVE